MTVRAFVIAMLNEAEAVKPHLKATDRLYVSGIGKVNAAAATQKAICEGATEIWNAGLAGGFDPTMKVGEVVEISAAVEYDFDIAKLNGTRVGQLNERDSPFIPVSPFARSGAQSLRRCVLASGDRFNDSDADLALLKELGATVRDMEGAAIAHVCEKEGVPCFSVKCISDVHGLGSMTEQYLDNLPFCLERLSAVLAAILA